MTTVKDKSKVWTPAELNVVMPHVLGSVDAMLPIQEEMEQAGVVIRMRETGNRVEVGPAALGVLKSFKYLNVWEITAVMPNGEEFTIDDKAPAGYHPNLMTISRRLSWTDYYGDQKELHPDELPENNEPRLGSVWFADEFPNVPWFRSEEREWTAIIDGERHFANWADLLPGAPAVPWNPSWQPV